MRPERKALTLNELIDLLHQVPKEYGDLEVQLEGCDCVGEAAGVSITEPFSEDKKSVVYLSRTDGERIGHCLWKSE